MFSGDEFTYSISGDDAWMFNITSEGVLELAAGIYADFESEEILNITVTATDILGQSVSKDFAFVKTKKVIKKNKYLKIRNINLTLFFYLIW